MVKENTMKQTEIGLLPEDWDVKKLYEVGVFSKGKGISKSEANSGNIPAIRYGELYTKHHNVIRKFYSFINSQVASNSIKLKKGDILFAGSGETKEEIGKSVAFINDEETFVGGDIVILSPYKNCEPTFFGYLLNSKEIQKQKSANGQGDAVVHIYSSSLKDVKIPLPPLPEQEAIAEALSDADAWIESLEQLIAKKRLIKQGAMQELLTPKEDWEVKKLGEVCSILNNLRIPIKESSRIKGDTPYYGANGIQGYIEGFTHNGDYVLVAEDGANDLNNYPINYVSGKIWVNNHAHVLQGILSILSTRFLSYLLKSIDFQNVLVGGTRAKLNKSILEKIEFSFPSLTEQTRIATILSDMDAELEALEGQLGKARKVKQGMMQELLTGRIRLI